MAGPTMQVDSYALNNMRRASQQAEQRRRDMERNLESARHRVSASADELRQRSAASAQEIQQKIESEAKRLLSGMDEIRTDFGLALGRQNLQLRRELDSLRVNLTETGERLDALNAKVDEMSRKFDADLKAVIDRIAGQKDRAQAYSNQLTALLAQIDELHPDKLTPGRAEQLHEAERFVQANIANSDYQAAIGLSQSSIPDAVSLIAELERLNAEYDDYVIRVQTACLNVSSRIKQLTDAQANQKSIRMGEGDEEREYTYDGNLEFWTSGIFSQLCDTYAHDERQILDEFLPQMDIENLKIAASSIPKFLARMDSCQTLADNEFSISCAVQDTAIRIYNALTEDDSWVLDESGFESMDMRRSYLETFSDNLGNITQIVILPGRAQTSAGAQGPILFSVGTFSPGADEGMNAVLYNAVVGRLDSSGVDTRACQKRGRSGLQMDRAAFAKSEYVAGGKIKQTRLDFQSKQIIPKT